MEDIIPTPTAGSFKAHNWVKGKPLGSGTFGVVSKAFNPTTMQIFAVKEVFLDGNSKHRDRLALELSICQNLRHPNIVAYLGHEYGEQHLRIFLEYVPGGSVASLLAEFGPLDDKALRRASQGTLLGLHYLHTRSPPVVHRDIKGANLLVDTTLSVKLADFGCSKWSSDTTSFTTLGSVPWMAPEVITQIEGYGRKADIWSFGCTVIEMATAEKPWGDGTFDNVMFAMNHIAKSDETPPLPERAPQECCEMIAQCTRRSQSRRPSTVALLHHDFLVPSSCGDVLDIRRTRTM